jgi:hypothetical protein
MVKELSIQELLREVGEGYISQLLQVSLDALTLEASSLGTCFKLRVSC